MVVLREENSVITDFVQILDAREQQTKGTGFMPVHALQCQDTKEYIAIIN